jgi:putative tryptophan/tyrosine transport system substrate-binding protein
MRRREFMSLFASAVVCANTQPSALRAQAGGMYRIGILETLPPDRNKPNFSALLRGLREHGYIEGQNLQIEYRSADGRSCRSGMSAIRSLSRVKRT